MRRYGFSHLLITLITILLIFIIYHQVKPFSVDDVRNYSWVPDTCGNGDTSDSDITQYCSGDMTFPDTDIETRCQLKNDGYFYHDNKPIGKLVGGDRRPFIPDSAPRTGGSFDILDLKTQKICSFDSSS